MLGVKSDGIGGDYVVMRASDRKVVTGVLLLFPHEDRGAVAIVRQCGHTEWADRLDKYWGTISDAVGDTIWP